MLLKKSVLIAVILLLIPIISAEEGDFDVIFTPVLDNIKNTEAAIFNLTIQNNLETTERFKITGDYPKWDAYTDPIQNPLIIAVGPKTNKTITLFVDPLPKYDIGAYKVYVTVKSESSGYTSKTPLRIAIATKEPGEYIPTVVVNLEMDDEIDPRNSIPIRIHLNNQNILDITDLTIKIESNVITDEVKHELGPKERKTVELTQQIDPLIPPQQDTLILTLLRGEEIIEGPFYKDFSIIEYAEYNEAKITKKILKTEKDIEFYSNNENYQGIMKVEINPFKSLFTSTTPKATAIKENGIKYLTWTVTLEDKLMKVKVTENYRPLFYILIVILVLVLIYYQFRVPLVIQKTIDNIEKKEGGISNLNVLLTIKNRGKVQLKEIEITDKIPNIADIEKEVSIGTLQPIKVLRHEKKGTLVKWILDSLDVGEERVVRYRVKSKLSILGGFSLPSATGKLRHKNREMITKSNRINLTS